MPDSLLERKDRFICITRAWPLADTRTPTVDLARVLEDIKLINERETPPMNYSPLSFTVDTREKGTAKKLICVKMVERQAGMKSICDILFLYRSKRPPQSYTLIGDINGLQMCVKEGTVPPMRAAPPVPANNPSNLYPNPLTGSAYPPTHQQQSQAPDYSTTMTKKSEDKDILDGIPFEINPKYLAAMRSGRQGKDASGLEAFRILSPYEIEQYFNYDFNIERSAM